MRTARIALSALFSGGADDGLALTAVGDPIQSIYGWRGASATNLPRFATDFPLADGSPAPTLELRTSWRNPPEALHLANAVSAEARRRSVSVRELLPRPDAESGDIRCALLRDVATEREWVADEIAHRYLAAETPPTTAVLVRRNADAAPMAEALTARGIPVEVVGLAGLLAVPEVADVVAMLRLVADPTAGSAAIRVLTGPRLRIGARDVAALWQRAVELDGPRVPTTTAQIVAQAAVDADSACLADAISDPGPEDRYSPQGYARIVSLSRELTSLRAHLAHPLPDLVAEVRRILGVDTEARAARPAGSGWGGTEHLDAFGDVVADFASRADGSARTWSLGTPDSVSCRRTASAWTAPVTTSTRSSTSGRTRATVSCSSERPLPARSSRNFGCAARDSGQSRVPAPPAGTTAQT